MDHIQLTRIYSVNGIFDKHAYIDARKRDDFWMVHFHADHAPSQDYLVKGEDMVNVFTFIEIELTFWALMLDAKFPAVKELETA